ncbi:acyl carrier protein [Cyanobium sp. ATX 6A2]|uniref:phosphopantetheine-binding protein n=1 Tax=Cyanobium sp. ATX 6A2 TaxID=2823700 RepID=UPI0020CF0DFF|nr:phosphopantetheine-binding protein [Cyanobium sp. ATX 6A2]MCP9887547.1 acyl carrier protein [Cyanobium sp. ATX 6A2]
MPPPNLEGLEAELRQHHATLPIERFGLDSLGRMEFCIHLELDHGVVITPETLITMESVEALIQSIRAQVD